MELSPCPNEVVHFISVCMHFCIIAYMHTSIYAYNANWGASTKIYQKPIENRSEIDPKTVPNRSQIGPKSVQDRLRNRPRCQHRFWTVLEPFSDRFGPALGGLLAASRGSSWGQVGPKIDFWRSWMAFKNEHDAGYLSEPIFGRFGSHLGVENGAQMAPKPLPKPARKRKAEMLIFDQPSYVFA